MLDPIDGEVFNVHYPNYNYISSVYCYYVLKNLAFLLTHLIFSLDPMEKVSFDMVLCKKEWTPVYQYRNVMLFSGVTMESSAL